MNIDTNNIFDQTNLNWLKSNTIYLTMHGSHAYGLARPDSDIDLRGIAIPDKKTYLGILNTFEQAQFSDPYDCVIFSLNKFVKLSLDCNPNAIELLFTDPEDHIFKQKIFQKLLDIRDEFLSKKARYTFAGYARAQLKRINLHRRWLLNQSKYEKRPERSDFNLPDNKKLIPTHKLQEINAQIEKKLNEWNFDSTGLDNDVAINIKNEIHDILEDLSINKDDMHLYAARSIGLDDNLLECFKREREYSLALKDWKNYNEWEKNRNRERYEMEKKYGIDCKHASHLVRLFKQCVELLSTGQLIVKRSDREELLAIKNGAWTYEQLIEWSDEQEKILNDLYEKSSLKREPNRVRINNIMIEMIEEMIF